MTEQTISKTWPLLRAFDESADIHTVVITAEVPPEDEGAGDVVRVKGMKPRKEQIVLRAEHLAHAPDGSPTVIGRAFNFRDAEVTWKGQPVAAKLADIEFAGTPLAAQYKTLWPQFINEVSIGARVKKAQPLRKGDPMSGTDYLETELFELSVVGVGCNPGATKLAALEQQDSQLNERIERFDALLKKLEALVDDVDEQRVLGPKAAVPADGLQAQPQQSADTHKARLEALESLSKRIPA